MTQSKTVFILEDDEMIRGSVVSALNNAGFETCCYSNEVDFRSALAEPNTSPNVIILDIMAPIGRLTKDSYERTKAHYANLGDELPPAKKTGLRIAHDIKTSDQFIGLKGTPIVIYSILKEDSFREEASNLGIVYFVKGENELQDLVNHVIKVAL